VDRRCPKAAELEAALPSLRNTLASRDKRFTRATSANILERNGAERVLSSRRIFQRDALSASFDMLMPGLEDIRGRLGVAYQALRCFSSSLISFFLVSLLSFFSPATTHVRPALPLPLPLPLPPLSLSLSLSLRASAYAETHDQQLSRTSGTKRAKKPVYLAGLQDRRSHAIVISRDCKKMCTYIHNARNVRVCQAYSQMTRRRQGESCITSYLERLSNPLGRRITLRDAT